MITDSQIKEEAFLEDIDSLLNTGEVANLYAVDEKQELIEAIRPVLAGKYGKDREFTPLGWFSSSIFRLECSWKLSNLIPILYRPSQLLIF